MFKGNDYETNSELSTLIDIHKVDTIGQHIIVDYYACSILNEIDISQKKDQEELVGVLTDAISLSRSEVIEYLTFDFKGTGFSAVFLLAESHFSIHIWPDEKYVSLDMYSCGKTYPQRTISYLERYFRPSFKTETTLNRGTRHIS